MKKNGVAHGSGPHPSKGQTKQAIKALVQNEAMHEVKKEVEKILHTEVHTRHPKRGGRSNRGSRLASAAGVHTAVIGTGVETLQGLAGTAPKRALSRNGRECVYSSVDWVGTVTIPATNAVGDRLFSVPLAPALVPVTRLALESQQWEKYMVESWEFLFVTTQGTTTSGQLIAFVDPDPRDDWVNDPYNVSKAAAQFGSMPINVWQNFGTRLPLTKDTKVTAFYTNPTTSSDVRFSQPGVLRVINAGGWSTLPAGGLTVYNVYQRVTLRFMDPELSVTSGAAAKPVGTVTDTTPKASTVGTPLFSASATIASGISLTVASDGTLNIDTSSIGDNNVVIEFEAQVENSSDVETTIGLDPQATSTLDHSISTVRAVFSADNTLVGQLTALAHVLLDGTKSWSLQTVLLGVATVAVRQAYARIWVVPRSTTTLEAAARITGIKPGVKRPPHPRAAVYTPPEWYSSTATFGKTLSNPSTPVGTTLTYGLLQQNGATKNLYQTAGLDCNVYYYAPNNRISFQWDASDVGEVYYISFSTQLNYTTGVAAINSGPYSNCVNGTMTSFLNTNSNTAGSLKATFFGLFTPTTAGRCEVWFYDSTLQNNTASTIGFGSVVSIRITQTYDSNVAAIQHHFATSDMPEDEDTDDEELHIVNPPQKVKRIASRFA